MNKDENEEQYLIFLKYTREYLSQVTGYSRGYLSRIATGNKDPSESFIGLCCQALKESQDDLFKLIAPHKASMAPAPPLELTQELLQTIDELGNRLTEAEAKIEALQNEHKQKKEG